jgi:hypothetical protein
VISYPLTGAFFQTKNKKHNFQPESAHYRFQTQEKRKKSNALVGRGNKKCIKNLLKNTQG